MDPAEIESLIESSIDGAKAAVRPARGPEDEDHLAARVIAPAFEGLSLVEQHQLVYDALGEHMTRDIHALELKTLTPEEAAGD